MNNIGVYAKAVVALLTAGLAAVAVALADNTVTNLEWVTIAAAVVTAVGVYVTPNAEPVATLRVKAVAAEPDVIDPGTVDTTLVA